MARRCEAADRPGRRCGRRRSRRCAQAAEAWLAGAERGEVRNRSGDPYKPSTLRGYRHALEERVLPLIGGEKLSAITTSDLQLLVDRWQADGLPASTLRNIIKPLQAIYRRAKSRGGLAVNPTRDLELPAPRPREVEIVSPDDRREAPCRPTRRRSLRLGDRAVRGAALRRAASPALGRGRRRRRHDRGPRVVGRQGRADRSEDEDLAAAGADARGAARAAARSAARGADR